MPIKPDLLGARFDNAVEEIKKNERGCYAI